MQQIPVHQFLTKAERRQLLQKNDRKAILEILHTWGWIVAAFALVYFLPNVLTVIMALFVLGGKQLACAIIMHDTSHRSMFTNPQVNDFVGKWLGAYPIFNDMLQYRPYHLQHHLHTGLEEDPDLLLTKGYPAGKKSMLRKWVRDLSGRTGLRGQFGLFLMHIGYLTYNLGNKVERHEKAADPKHLLRTAARRLPGPLMANALMFGILWLIGAPWLYVLWIGALLTTFQFSTRVRSMAEHAMSDRPTDPLFNTRTTYANWLERMLFAPHHVNYHMEHHLLMTVPSYHLPKMHQLLLEKGFYDQYGMLEKGYLPILRRAMQDRAKPVAPVG